MHVQDCMTRRIATVEPDDRLALVRDIFAATHFHHLLVVEADKLVGVVSDRDLLKALSPHLGTAAETPRDAASLNTRVHQIMSRHPVVICPDAAIDAVVDLFKHHTISCVPVVDEIGHPIGIFTWRDLLKHWQSRD